MTKPADCHVRIFRGGFMLMLGLIAQGAFAVPTVDMTVTPLGGGTTFRYEVSVNNTSLEDVILVNISDAPLGDLLIDATLIAPVGFLADYDPGAGLTFGAVTFLEGTSLFAAGTTIGGFSFESNFSPAAHFSLFDGFEADLDPFEGRINRIISTAPITGGVPDGGSTLFIAGIGLVALAVVRSRGQLSRL